jgi:hypothetical protein
MELDELVADLGMYAHLPGKTQKIRVFMCSVGGDNAITSGQAMRQLVDYFGEPKKQERDPMYSMAFSELDFLEDILSEVEWMFGREGRVILMDQIAFCKKKEDKVQIAVYRPFEGLGDEATIQVFDYDVKDTKEMYDNMIGNTSGN